MPEPLTSLERRILDYVIEYLRRNTYQPSIREIGRRFDIKSTKTVSEYLQSLADKGWIERDPSRSRGVRLLGIDLTADTVAVPCYEDVVPPEAQLPRDAALETLCLDRRLAGSAEAFSLVMRGDSMAGAGILDGDLLILEPVAEAELADGEIVAARVGGEGTVKHYFRRGEERVLEPANPDYAPMLVRPPDLQVAGRVTAIVRRLRGGWPAEVAPVAEAKDGGVGL